MGGTGFVFDSNSELRVRGASRSMWQGDRYWRDQAEGVQMAGAGSRGCKCACAGVEVVQVCTHQVGHAGTGGRAARGASERVGTHQTHAPFAAACLKTALQKLDSRHGKL